MLHSKEEKVLEALMQEEGSKEDIQLHLAKVLIWFLLLLNLHDVTKNNLQYKIYFVCKLTM